MVGGCGVEDWETTEVGIQADALLTFARDASHALYDVRKPEGISGCLGYWGLASHHDRAEHCGVL